MNKPKYRIKKITELGGRVHYVCERRHWLWGWGDMFIINTGWGRQSEKFATEDSAVSAINLYLKNKEDYNCKIVWEGKL